MFFPCGLLACILLLTYCSACEYDVEVLEIKPCKGVKNELEVQNPGVELNDACNIVPKGCLLLKDPCNSLEVNYKCFLGASPLPVLQGKKQACNMEVTKDTKIKCPTKKNEKFCAQKDWSFSVPKKALDTAAAGGVIKVRGELKTNHGISCFEGAGKVVKKK
ncbi:uncharacterized protein [Rhodnius prolixus]|uniref:uncharacterized protein n=1 Tax=Rhodnius prolixus TaxID=13249 RepID=UPI003D18B217